MDTDPSSQTDTDQEVPLRTQASLTKAALFLPIDASRPSSATPGHGVLTAKQVSELVPERGAPEPPSGSHVHARGNHDEAEEAAGSRTPTAHAQEDRGPPPLPSPRHEVSEGQLTRYGELEREFSDKFSDVFGENWTKEHEHEVDRMLFASVSRIRGHNTELGACVHDFNCWRETVAKQSLVPNNVLSRCTIIAGRLLRSEAALRVGVEQLLDDVLKITPDSMRRHLGTLLADCRSERRLRMLMEKERDEAVKAATDVRYLKAGLLWGGMAFRLIAKRTRQHNARRFADLQKQVRNLARRLGTVKAGRSAVALAMERRMSRDAVTGGAATARGHRVLTKENAAAEQPDGAPKMIQSALSANNGGGTRLHGKNLDQFNRALHNAIEDGAERQLLKVKPKTAISKPAAPPTAPPTPTAASMTAASSSYRGNTSHYRRPSGFTESVRKQMRDPMEMADVFEPITYKLPIDPEEASVVLTESPGTNHVREWYSRSDVLAMQVAHSRKLIALQSACERRLQQASAYWKARNKAIAESAIEKSVVLARQLKPTKGGGGNNLNIDGDPSVRAILRGGGAAFPQPDPPPGAPSAEIIEDMKDLDAGAAAAIAAVTSDGA